MANENIDSKFSENVLGSIQEHISVLTERIKHRAIELSMDDGQNKEQKVGITYVTAAITEYAPGYSVPPRMKAIRLRWWEVFFTYVSPLTIISAMLAILFAVLGLWASGAVGELTDAKVKLLDGKAYLDIAKIFAGAIVGSATASAASAISQRKKNIS